MPETPHTEAGAPFAARAQVERNRGDDAAADLFERFASAADAGYHAGLSRLP